jgi:hypothetical protein
VAGEREIDVAVTTLGNHRNAMNRYVIPHLGSRHLYTLDKRAVNDLYRHLLARGGKDRWTARRLRPADASTMDTSQVDQVAYIDNRRLYNL